MNVRFYSSIAVLHHAKFCRRLDRKLHSFHVFSKFRHRFEKSKSIDVIDCAISLRYLTCLINEFYINFSQTVFDISDTVA